MDTLTARAAIASERPDTCPDNFGNRTERPDTCPDNFGNRADYQPPAMASHKAMHGDGRKSSANRFDKPFSKGHRARAANPSHLDRSLIRDFPGRYRNAGCLVRRS